MAQVISSNLIPICVLRILEKYSDPETPVTQEEIKELLNKEYGVNCERKALGRTLRRMRDELGIDIRCSRKGSWLDSRLLDDGELELLADMILDGRKPDPEQTASLLDKLCKLSSINFRYRLNRRLREREIWAARRNGLISDRTDVSEVREKICKAIKAKRMLSFNFSANGNWHLSPCRLVSPQTLTFREKEWILSALDESGALLKEFPLAALRSVRVVDLPAAVLVKDDARISGAS